MRVSSDSDTPLPAVSVLRDGQQVGATGQSGTLRLRLSGVEGESVTLSIRCPAGHRQLSDGVAVVLKSVADSAHVPEYAFSCPPELRKVVVAIRAEHGPNLPVLYLGRELARTDELGTAHVLLEQAPDSQFELTLDTSEGAALRLRPQNPSVRFVVRDQDEVLSMVQTFVADRPVRPTRPNAVQRALPSGPIKL